MSDERIEEIVAMERAATNAPWWFDESDLCWRLHGTWGWTPEQLDGKIPAQPVNKQILKAPKKGTTMAEYWPDEADAAFIIGARTAVPELLAEIKRLKTLPASCGCEEADVAYEQMQTHLLGVIEDLRRDLAEIKAIGECHG